MQAERLTLHGEVAAFAAQLRARVPAAESVALAVGEIIEAVRETGDGAVIDFTERFDHQQIDSLIVEEGELSRCEAALRADVRRGLEMAIENVRRVAEHALVPHGAVDFGTHTVAIRSAPVERAAVYVPGGRAPYPSTVVMGVVTARVAGVAEIAVCSPPPIDEVTLAACSLTGVRRVYGIGGAQAIAALAYGTESVRGVDVIVGPGNLYVQEAKRQVSGEVGIDGFAGPSDLVVISDEGADPELVAADLLAQAEHGAGTLVVAVSQSGALLDELADRLANTPETGAAAVLVVVSGLEQALALAQALAPEHLELIGPRAEDLAPRITRAGCVFVGAAAGTAFGDYIAGSNHVLPTGGAARFASALSVASFRRRFTEVSVKDPAPLARVAAPVARAEAFELHARSMEARIRDNH
jgi:histidinol dehydrogenase